MYNRDDVLALLEPLKNKKFPAKNRFLRSATALFASKDDGAATQAEKGRLAELAAGGVGTLITGAGYISGEGKSYLKQWGLDSDKRIADVAGFSEAARKYGAKLVVQIAHSGGNSRAELADEALSPSGLNHLGSDLPTRKLSRGEIEKIIEDFAKAARRAKEGGADGVQIHGAHGFLLTQFLSPLLNVRGDEYGGVFENRLRIFREVLSAVRASVGDDFPVWFKISVSEGVEGGYEAPEGLAAAKILLEDGADGIEVSSGTSYSRADSIPAMIGVSAGESEAPFRPFAEELKKSCAPDKLVILTGGIRSLAVMGGLIKSGACDLLGMSRPLIAEPDFINRLYEEDSRPSACFSCNACLKSTWNVDCPILREKNEGNWDPL